MGIVEKNLVLNERHKPGDLVLIKKGHAAGKIGRVGEVHHGAYKGAPKSYVVDYSHEHQHVDNDSGHLRSVRLQSHEFKKHGMRELGENVVNKVNLERMPKPKKLPDELITSGTPSSNDGKVRKEAYDGGAPTTGTNNYAQSMPTSIGTEVSGTSGRVMKKYVRKPANKVKEDVLDEHLQGYTWNPADAVDRKYDITHHVKYKGKHVGHVFKDGDNYLAMRKGASISSHNTPIGAITSVMNHHAQNRIHEGFKGNVPNTLAAIASHAYTPEVGHRIRTRRGGQIPGIVTKVDHEKGVVHFYHPDAEISAITKEPYHKKYKTGINNVMREEVVNEESVYNEWLRSVRHVHGDVDIVKQNNGVVVAHDSKREHAPKVGHFYHDSNYGSVYHKQTLQPDHTIVARFHKEDVVTSLDDVAEILDEGRSVFGQWAAENKLKKELARAHEKANPDPVVKALSKIGSSIRKYKKSLGEDLKVGDETGKSKSDMKPAPSTLTRKYLGKTRGTTATGSPAHIIDVSPKIGAHVDKNKTSTPTSTKSMK